MSENEKVMGQEEDMEVFGLDDIETANTSVDEIDAEDVNLIFVGIDCSGSMNRYTSDMKSALKEFKTALTESKEADQILIARADFDDGIVVGGYKKIEQLDTDYTAGGMTALYDVIVDGVDKLKQYRDFLKQQGMRVKAVFAIFSDGEDTNSKHTFSDAKKSVDYLNKEEITTAYISFGSDASATAKKLGFMNVLDVASSASELRKAFNCLSKSVIESSKSVLPDGDDFFNV